jgi:DNA polymerase-3 subunit delta|tara:strand:- start:707 stop:1711 length:1005 start_codon:yes stop_codon:yes gene_type:complete
MILKSYETSKIDLKINNLVLFYGQNQGAKEEKISKILEVNKDKSLNRYDEKEILENTEIFYENILSESLFEDEKIILINRATDKIVRIIEEVIEKDISKISILINSNILEKRSKLRSIFEKDKKLVCIPFYPDSPETLSKLSYNYFKENKVVISQENINLIVNRCNGDRGVLKNELEKIKFLSQSKKKLLTEDLLKISNLIENHGITELVDNCLAKNQRKIISIMNENNFSNEDCITIVRTFLSKLKRLSNLANDYNENKNLDKTIANAKPPIFWKDKQLVKQQINRWTYKQIKKILFEINEIELQIKKNNINPVNIISNFVLDISSKKISNKF